MTRTVKISDLKVGDTFISKGSKLTLARVKGETETTRNLFCLQHIMSSYSSFVANKDLEVTLL